MQQGKATYEIFILDNRIVADQCRARALVRRMKTVLNAHGLTSRHRAQDFIRLLGKGTFRVLKWDPPAYSYVSSPYEGNLFVYESVAQLPPGLRDNLQRSSLSNPIA